MCVIFNGPTRAAVTRNRKVGVMATAGTLASARYARLVRDYGSGIEVVPQPCPGLADLVEEGHFDSERLLARLEQLTLPLKKAAVDTVVLGCTHYAFVSEPLARVLGPDVRIGRGSINLNQSCLRTKESP